MVNSAASKNQRNPKKTKAPPAKRGKFLTGQQLELIGDAFKTSRAEFPHLKSIGFSRLKLPSSIKRTAASKAIAGLN